MKAQGTKDPVYVIGARPANRRHPPRPCGRAPSYWKSVANWPLAGIVEFAMTSPLTASVGVPMPLLSYGGTSAVSLLAGLGVVMAVRAHRPVHGR